MARDLTQRLTALAQAHELVRPSFAEQNKAARLADLIAVLLAAYDDKGVIGDRIRVAVPEVLASEGSITTLALVVHELATNSLKYGALSKASGTLELSGAADDNEVVIVWTEKGGPPIPTTRGERALEANWSTGASRHNSAAPSHSIGPPRG
jgi:two-component sensor histidine kinase